MAVPSDVQIAVSELTVKKPIYDTLWSYYDGMPPLVWTSEKLREIFSTSFAARFTENWCAPIIDSRLDRMELSTPTVPDNEDATGALDDLWELTGLVDDEYEVHADVAVVGEGFVIAWPNEDGEIEAFHNDARLCHVEYDQENPRIKRFGSKWWNAADGTIRLTLYYPDHFEYYGTVRAMKIGEQPDAKAFIPLDGAPDATNEWGIIPMFHFRSNRRKIKSQLESIWQIQDMTNKLLADMMVAAEFGAFPQRYVISAGGISGLQNNPNAIWDLVASDVGTQATSAGQFVATQLANYLVAIQQFITDMGVISGTPRHYFYQQGGDPSGEALIAMESPLTAKVERLQKTLIPTWRDLAAFILLLDGMQIESQDIEAKYAEVKTIQPRTMAEIRKMSVEAGLPLRTVLRRGEGWTSEELKEMEDDAAADKEQQATFADAALSQVQKQFNSGTLPGMQPKQGGMMPPPKAGVKA